MKRAGPAVTAVLLASLIGCYSDAIEPSPPPNPSVSATARETVGPTATPSLTFEPLVAPVAGTDELLYYCAAIPFPISAVTRRGEDELVNHPAANALRLLLAAPSEAAFLPNRGWIFLGESLTVAEFFAREPGESDPFGGYYANFDKAGPQYRARSWGGCRPRLHPPPGTMSLEWSLAGLRLPGREATSVAVEVLPPESSCGPDPRSVETLSINSDADSVTVTLVAQQVDGGLLCPGPGCGPIRPSAYEVALPEPLGDRRLFDGSTYPGRAVNEPWERGCGG